MNQGSAFRTTRRQFAKIVTGAAASTLAMPAFLRARNLNEKLNIAIIGSGGRGRTNTQGVASENIVALCDVYEPAIAQAAEKFPKARRCLDFRELFDDHSNEFDAVVISTPESSHVFATLAALRLGKHVYCEKPLTHSIAEARKIREVAAEAKVSTQMGTQNHASENYRKVVELIQSGAIGAVQEAHVWVSRAWGWQSAEAAERNKDIVSIRDRPEGSSPIPEGLDWNLWLGAAPNRPFHEVYFPGPKWYRWWDFGSGTMSDLGSHWNDLPFWALKLDAPKTIEAFGPPPHPELAPASMHVTYEYGPRGDAPPVRLTWYQGEDKPEPWQSGLIPQWPNGVLFIGEKGMLLSDYRQHVLLPEEQFQDFQAPEPFLPAPENHYVDWIEGCKTGSTTGSPFDYASQLTEANHLGNIAYRLGKKLEWDAEAMRATNAPEADSLIQREYRKGWSLS